MQHAFPGGQIVDGLNDAERRALALIGAGDVIWDWDVARDRIFTSSEAEESLGFKRGALEGPARDWLEVLHPQDRDRFKATLDAAVENRRGRLAQTLRLKARDGHYQWFRLRARPIIGNDGEVIRCVGTLLDITDAKTAQQRLLHDAIHDNLTGLPNRELFMDRLGTAIIRAQSDANARPAVFLIDIDRFRQVNESVGLSVGDSILLTVARRLGRLLKPLDTLARLEGDHFGLILVSEQSPERVAAFADAVKRAVRAAIAFGEREIFLTASIGIAMLDGETPEAIDQIRNAELAVAFAKRLGGDRIETFRPALKMTANDAQRLEADLHHALECDEIKVLYQPIIKLGDHSVSGFEAQLRWDHPKRGRISPVDFIPIAERSDLIVTLGLFVLERAARQLGDWQTSLPGRDKLFMNVNLSSRQLLRHDLINDVKAILSRHSLPKGTLKLELTESLVMENLEFSTQVLQHLKELGTGLLLDDFGTGFSSLAYLQRLPADTLKIDRSFLKASGRNRTAILKSIINMAHEMGLDVVAEGAETEADVTELHDLGADYVQSYFFSHPMLPEEVRKFVERTAKSKMKQT
jgi:diguanylate cyclase (GGDEF)-like protein/PAS domain S-box-containing protein